MPATTIVTDEATTVIEEDAGASEPRSRFSWSAALAGAVVATAVTLFLLTLGTGVGLSLVTTPKLLHGAAPAFLTLGAIYFLASYAFGFAVGGHLVGRLIGPAVETRKEEEFRAGAHGVAVWAIGVVATSLLAAAGALVAEGSAPNMLAVTGLSSASKDGSDLTPLTTGYWVDVLFRSTSFNSQASLSGFVQYAQAAQSDMQSTSMQSAPPTAQPMTPVPSGTDDEAGATQPAAPTHLDQSTPMTSSPAPSAPADISIPDTASPAPTATVTSMRNIAADKAETGRILDVAMANGGVLSADDRDQIARLVSADVPISNAAAEQRVQDVTNRIRADEIKTVDTARRVTSYAALWAALALLFGAIVATMAAVSARWEDDEVSMIPFARD
jgi:hypothetical protein